MTNKKHTDNILHTSLLHTTLIDRWIEIVRQSVRIHTSHRHKYKKTVGTHTIHIKVKKKNMRQKIQILI